MFSKLKSLYLYIRENRFTRSLMRYFDWPLFLMVIAISLFGIVCIFSATSSEVTEYPSTVMEMLETQSITYPRLQLIWLVIGTIAMSVIIFFPYELYGQYSSAIYLLNILMLMLTLAIAEVGRGGMQAFLSWGSSSERGFQPSELGKVMMIMCFAKTFSVRKRPIQNLHDIFPLVIYLAIPLFLIVAQPDFGTAMVYLAVFCVLVFVSGTSWKLILSVLGIGVLLIIPVWYFMNNTENFRLTRILIWLDPFSYPDEARQVINAQIAVGSGDVFGKGIISPGSLASLGYISDDHTDFIYAVVCESFGLVGGCGLILAYLVLLGRLIYLSLRVHDPYGSYIIIGVMAMFLFHIFENISMVIGLMPVTGIPLPFVSYGGSNMLTNMMAIGLVENVVMRTKMREVSAKLNSNRAWAL